MGKGSSGAPRLILKVAGVTKSLQSDLLKSSLRLCHPKAVAGCFVTSCLVKAEAIEIGVKETKEHNHENDISSWKPSPCRDKSLSKIISLWRQPFPLCQHSGPQAPGLGAAVNPHALLANVGPVLNLKLYQHDGPSAAQPPLTFHQRPPVTWVIPG